MRTDGCHSRRATALPFARPPGDASSSRRVCARVGSGKRDRSRDRGGSPMRKATVIGARALAVIAVALTAGVLVATESAASTPSLSAPGGPGGQSYLDLARKD